MTPRDFQGHCQFAGLVWLSVKFARKWFGIVSLVSSKILCPFWGNYSCFASLSRKIDNMRSAIKHLRHLTVVSHTLPSSNRLSFEKSCFWYSRQQNFQLSVPPHSEDTFEGEKPISLGLACQWTSRSPKNCLKTYEAVPKCLWRAWWLVWLFCFGIHIPRTAYTVKNYFFTSTKLQKIPNFQYFNQIS